MAQEGTSDVPSLEASATFESFMSNKLVLHFFLLSRYPKTLAGSQSAAMMAPQGSTDSSAREFKSGCAVVYYLIALFSSSALLTLAFAALSEYLFFLW